MFSTDKTLLLDIASRSQASDGDNKPQAEKAEMAEEDGMMYASDEEVLEPAKLSMVESLTCTLDSKLFAQWMPCTSQIHSEIPYETFCDPFCSPGVSQC